MPYHHIIITLLLLLFTNTQAQVNYTLTGTTASKHSKIALYKGFGLNKHNTFIQLEKDKVVKAIVDNEDTEDEETTDDAVFSCFESLFIANNFTINLLLHLPFLSVKRFILYQSMKLDCLSSR